MRIELYFNILFIMLVVKVQVMLVVEVNIPIGVIVRIEVVRVVFLYDGEERGSKRN